MIKLNSKIINFGVFPNKEFNLKFDQLIIKETNNIDFIYQDNSDLIKLSLLKGYLDDMNTTCNLYIFNMPYSRMDRANGYYVPSLKYICNFFNSLNFNSIVIREPHSNVTLNLLNNSIVDMWCGNRIKYVLSLLKYDSIFFPDFGAYERYSDFIGENLISVSFGVKKREFETGNIISYSVNGSIGDKVLIIDDICSRGGTFVEASNKLKEFGVNSVSLLVSYCEENVFTGELFNHIEYLYTSEDIPLTDHKQIIKIK